MYQWVLPDGTFTNERSEYLSEWKKLRDALEKKYDIQVMAYDPHISFVDKKNKKSGWVDIPVWFAKRLINDK